MKLGKGCSQRDRNETSANVAQVAASVNVDGSPHRGGMLGAESMSAMRSCLNEILPEFQEGSRGGGKNAAEKIPHLMWDLNLDLRSKTSFTTCGVLTLT